MAVDFSKAFDTVDHIALLNCLPPQQHHRLQLHQMGLFVPAGSHSVLQLQQERVSGGSCPAGSSAGLRSLSSPLQLLRCFIPAICKADNLICGRLHGIRHGPTVRESRRPPYTPCGRRLLLGAGEEPCDIRTEVDGHTAHLTDPAGQGLSCRDHEWRASPCGSKPKDLGSDVRSNYEVSEARRRYHPEGKAPAQSP